MPNALRPFFYEVLLIKPLEINEQHNPHFIRKAANSHGGALEFTSGLCENRGQTPQVSALSSELLCLVLRVSLS